MQTSKPVTIRELQNTHKLLIALNIVFMMLNTYTSSILHHIKGDAEQKKGKSGKHFKVLSFMKLLSTLGSF